MWYIQITSPSSVCLTVHHFRISIALELQVTDLWNTKCEQRFISRKCPLCFYCLGRYAFEMCMVTDLIRYLHFNCWSKSVSAGTLYVSFLSHTLSSHNDLAHILTLTMWSFVAFELKRLQLSFLVFLLANIFTMTKFYLVTSTFNTLTPYDLLLVLKLRQPYKVSLVLAQN